MSKQMKIGLVVAALVAALVVFGMVTYIEHVRDDADTKAKIAIEQARADEAQKKIDEIRNQYEKRIVTLEGERKAITTPQAAERVIHEYTPLPNVTVAAEPPKGGVPLDSVLNAEDGRRLADFSIQCKECEVTREGYRQELDQKDAIIVSLGRERDLAIANAKGGNFLKRLKRNGKWLVIGMGVGAVATAAMHR